MATVESIVFAALKGLVAPNCCWADQAPENAATPYIVYQAVGGQDEGTLDGVPALQNTRMQVAAWGSSRLTAVSPLMVAIREALCNSGIRATPIGAPVSDYETDTKLYGSRQDFSIWWTP